MTKKHTPGPWLAQAKTNPDCNEGTHYIACADGALGYWCGHKQGHADSNWVLNQADARLIAAAPELLEVLKELSKSFAREYANDERSDSEIDAHIEYWESRATAVIAKATGDVS